MCRHYLQFYQLFFHTLNCLAFPGVFLWPHRRASGHIEFDPYPFHLFLFLNRPNLISYFRLFPFRSYVLVYFIWKWGHPCTMDILFLSFGNLTAVIFYLLLKTDLIFSLEFIILYPCVLYTHSSIF